ncbi:MAG: hypothetical protein ACREFB_05830 [Stellaceae bacterium]
MSGKWDKSGVPRKGWTCEGVEDLSAPNAVCEMCETQEIRYVHSMTHPSYPETLRVGCVCAEHMEGDYKAPRERERQLRNRAARRARWLGRRWSRARREGCWYLNTDGLHLAIWRSTDGTWTGQIKNPVSGFSVNSRRRYTSEDQMKLAAFDAMLALKERWGLGK